jgi:hypothetical protein
LIPPRVCLFGFRVLRVGGWFARRAQASVRPRSGMAFELVLGPPTPPGLTGNCKTTTHLWLDRQTQAGALYRAAYPAGVGVVTVGPIPWGSANVNAQGCINDCPGTWAETPPSLYSCIYGPQGRCRQCAGILSAGLGSCSPQSLLKFTEVY